MIESLRVARAIRPSGMNEALSHQGRAGGWSPDSGLLFFADEKCAIGMAVGTTLVALAQSKDGLACALLGLRIMDGRLFPAL